nr:MAG: dUTPase [Bacteriophage sp.]
MTLNEYQTEAMRTASRTATAHEDNLLLNGVMGLNGEAGEVIDMVKKMLFQGHTLDKDHMAKELGDCLWYLAVAAKDSTMRCAGNRVGNTRKTMPYSQAVRHGILIPVSPVQIRLG